MIRLRVVRDHWLEYLIEAFGLGVFMVSACLFGTLLEHPDSPVHAAIASPAARRGLMGMAMGLTAIAFIYSPWGQRSGAHINPGVTLSFYRLGKIAPSDTGFYVFSQFVGGAAGVLLSAAILRRTLADPAVNYVVTVPGPQGVVVAFLAELIISFGLMLTVLIASNSRHLHRFTGLFAGVLLAVYILLEAPLSGMSMNPARTLASALPARLWSGLWIYFTAPVIGMLLAAELYVRWRGAHAVFCAKLNHHGGTRCLFRCRYDELTSGRETTDQQETFKKD